MSCGEYYDIAPTIVERHEKERIKGDLQSVYEDYLMPCIRKSKRMNTKIVVIL